MYISTTWLPQVSPPAALTARCCSWLWSHKCSCRVSQSLVGLCCCLWEGRRHRYTVIILSIKETAAADWFDLKDDLRFITDAGFWKSNWRLQLWVKQGFMNIQHRYHFHSHSLLTFLWWSGQIWPLFKFRCLKHTLIFFWSKQGFIALSTMAD